ncbi:MAG: T9SS type A sorting domain-containing protein, partial [Bacteroidota bacterium]
ESDYSDQYVTDLDAVGFDWKEFDLTTFSWILPLDRVYFVRTNTDSLWQIQFVDFEGSSSGTSTYRADYLGLITSLETPDPQFEAFNLFPNPATTQITVSFDAKNYDNNAWILIYNSVGQEVFRASTGVDQGLNVRQIPIDLSAGMYQLQIQSLDGLITRPFIVQR